MEYRESTIFTGATFLVPETISRVDILPAESKSATHGWQLRYGECKGEPDFFSDKSTDGSGAAASLTEATLALIRRIHTIDAPTGLRKNACSFKKSDNPVGISGPLPKKPVKGRKVIEYEFTVSVPIFGKKPATKHVYIGTENTMTSERTEIALAKAIELRNKAVQIYQNAKNESMRAANPLPDQPKL
jgi:hypothetical protein